tara:strand:+ start:2667 stop:3650 length:984 start_codon:yes stop_codon:yes gene_type:complete
MKKFEELVETLTNGITTKEQASEDWELLLEFEKDARVWAALNHNSHVSILVEVPHSASHISTETNVLNSEIRENTYTGTHLRFWIEDDRFNSVFKAFCDRIANKVKDQELNDRIETIYSTLEIWKNFWTTSKDQMIFEEEIGLFGELQFLNGLESDTTKAVQSWTGGGLNATIRDFQYEKYDVEVKTTAAPPPTLTHHFHGLKQLEGDPDRELYLFSCAVIESPDGKTLTDLVEEILEKIHERPNAEKTFIEKLESRGFKFDANQRTFQTRTQRLYEIREDFPRIVSDSFKDEIPGAISKEKITYSLDMTLCDQWLKEEWPQTNELS